MNALLVLHPHYPLVPHQPSRTRTIPCFAPTPLPPLSKVRCCRPKKFGRLPEGLFPIRTINEIFHTIPITFRTAIVCVLIWFCICTIPLAFRRVSVCVCFICFASLRNFGHTRLRHPCLACPSRCIDPLHFYNLCKRTLITCLACTSRCTEYCHPPPIAKGQ